jgi:hypothetical protein
MAYRLKADRPVKSEVRRVARVQLRRAIDELASSPNCVMDATPHLARPRIKKALAAFHLLEPAREQRARRTTDRLERAARLLAEVADAEALAATFTTLAEQYEKELSPTVVGAIHIRLEHRRHRALRKASIEGTIAAAAALLDRERKRALRWRFAQSGHRALAPQLRQSLRAAQGARATAAKRPSMRHFHAWRSRVKTLWLQVRLIETRCGGTLAFIEKQLAALDDCLGEYHNCGLLANVFAHGWLASREDTTGFLHLIRRHQAALRDRASHLSRAVHREKPAAFIHRVRRHWHRRRPGRGVAARLQRGRLAA